mmetsp:Transcript_18930/g.44839  ORF Transcript_18930/g.44839 Transcript_18930/m.44839 type:complete len:181 (-) Transcript_18930:256-798(-)
MLRTTTAAVLALVAASANAQGNDGNAPNLTLDWPKQGNCPSTKITLDEYKSKYMCHDNAACRALDPTSCCILYRFPFCGFPGTEHGGNADTQCNEYNECYPDPDEAEPMSAEPPALPGSAEEFAAQLQALLDCPYDPATEEFQTCLEGIMAKSMDPTSAGAARETAAAVAAVVAGAALLA